MSQSLLLQQAENDKVSKENQSLAAANTAANQQALSEGQFNRQNALTNFDTKLTQKEAEAGDVNQILLQAQQLWGLTDKTKPLGYRLGQLARQNVPGVEAATNYLAKTKAIAKVAAKATQKGGAQKLISDVLPDPLKPIAAVIDHPYNIRDATPQALEEVKNSLRQQVVEPALKTYGVHTEHAPLVARAITGDDAALSELAQKVLDRNGDVQRLANADPAELAKNYINDRLNEAGSAAGPDVQALRNHIASGEALFNDAQNRGIDLLNAQQAIARTSPEAYKQYLVETRGLRSDEADELIRQAQLPPEQQAEAFISDRLQKIQLQALQAGNDLPDLSQAEAVLNHPVVKAYIQHQLNPDENPQVLKDAIAQHLAETLSDTPAGRFAQGIATDQDRRELLRSVAPNLPTTAEGEVNLGEVLNKQANFKLRGTGPAIADYLQGETTPRSTATVANAVLDEGIAHLPPTSRRVAALATASLKEGYNALQEGANPELSALDQIKAIPGKLISAGKDYLNRQVEAFRESLGLGSRDVDELGSNIKQVATNMREVPTFRVDVPVRPGQGLFPGPRDPDLVARLNALARDDGPPARPGQGLFADPRDPDLVARLNALARDDGPPARPGQGGSANFRVPVVADETEDVTGVQPQVPPPRSSKDIVQGFRESAFDLPQEEPISLKQQAGSALGNATTDHVRAYRFAPAVPTIPEPKPIYEPSTETEFDEEPFNINQPVPSKPLARTVTQRGIEQNVSLNDPRFAGQDNLFADDALNAPPPKSVFQRFRDSISFTPKKRNVQPADTYDPFAPEPPKAPEEPFSQFLPPQREKPAVAPEPVLRKPLIQEPAEEPPVRFLADTPLNRAVRLGNSYTPGGLFSSVKEKASKFFAQGVDEAVRKPEEIQLSDLKLPEPEDDEDASSDPYTLQATGTSGGINGGSQNYIPPVQTDGYNPSYQPGLDAQTVEGPTYVAPSYTQPAVNSIPAQPNRPPATSANTLYEEAQQAKNSEIQDTAGLAVGGSQLKQSAKTTEGSGGATQEPSGTTESNDGSTLSTDVGGESGFQLKDATSFTGKADSAAATATKAATETSDLEGLGEGAAELGTTEFDPVEGLLGLATVGSSLYGLITGADASPPSPPPPTYQSAPTVEALANEQLTSNVQQNYQSAGVEAAGAGPQTTNYQMDGEQDALASEL